MFDSLYPDAADSALKTRAAEVQPKPPTPWFQGFWGAIGSAPVRAGLETARAAKTVAPLQVGNPLAMSTTEQEGMLEDEGINRRNMDRGLRIAIEGMTPDPESTGAASMILHDVTRFVGKAVGYTAAVGPVGAVAGVGLDEGYNEAARRLDEGVDPATAAKLGVTKGIASGIAVALPVAGKSLLGTLGLAAGGGPVAFVAEQATAREILRSANYDELAGQIDPFDPLGLGVSFLGGLAFGGAAHAMRARRAPVSAFAKTESAPGTPAEVAPPGARTPVAEAAARVYTPEQVDAAHVSILQAQREGTALHRANDIESSAGHARALDRAADQMAAGERVSVGDTAPVDGARVAETVLPALARAVKVLDEVTGAHNGQVDGTLRATVDGQPAGYLDYTVYEGRPEISMVEVADEMRRQGIGAELVRELQRKFPDAEVGWGMMTPEGAALREALPKIVQEVASVRAKVSELESATAERTALEARAEEFDQVENPTPEQAAQRQQWFAEAAPRWNELHDRIEALESEVRGEPLIKTLIDIAAPAGRAKVESAAPAKPEASTTEGGAGKSDPSADYLARESDAIAQAEPDMLVMLEGMDAPVKVSDLLAEVKAMADQEIADAPLLQVAAECALRG